MVAYTTLIHKQVLLIAWLLGPLLIALSPVTGLLLSIILSLVSYTLSRRTTFVSLSICTASYSAGSLIHVSGLYKSVAILYIFLSSYLSLTIYMNYSCNRRQSYQEDKKDHVIKASPTY